MKGVEIKLKLHKKTQLYKQVKYIERKEENIKKWWKKRQRLEKKWKEWTVNVWEEHDYYLNKWKIIHGKKIEKKGRINEWVKIMGVK